MENENVFDRVRSLNLNQGEYVVVSGGVLEAHGIRNSGDLDLVVTQDVFERLLDQGWEIREGSDGVVLLVKDDIEVATDWRLGEYRPDPAKLIAEADTIEGCAFAQLDEVIKFKKEYNREKDKKDLELIYRYLEGRNY